MAAIESSEVQDLVGRWWFNYDEGHFQVLTLLLASDAHFTCRTDTGATAYEEFVRADFRGRDTIMEWQTNHRMQSPYPLRHNGTNVHVVDRSGESATFASYLHVTHITTTGVTPLSSGIEHGAVRRTADGLKIAALHVMLDTRVSDVFLVVKAQ